MEEERRQGAHRQGYLREDYRLFYLKKIPSQEIAYHYHDFHKILLMLSGHIAYGIEGRVYDLLPGDVVLVRAGEIHSPLFQDREAYERVIVYLSPDFGAYLGEAGAGLLDCFSKRPGEPMNLLRPQGQLAQRFAALGMELARLVKLGTQQEGEDALFDGLEKDLGELYRRMKVTELLLLADRCLGPEREAFRVIEAGGNAAVQRCIRYISEHIQEESLSIDQIAQALFLSRSHIMHRFKEETGCTLGEFIRDKRLFLAKNLLSRGASVTEACYQSGFKNYAAFYYAYKKKYHAAPTTGTPLGVQGREE